MTSVLLVEPHADTRELYAEFLGSRGFRAHAVATTAEAWPLVPAADIIVTEIQVMESSDGLEFVRRVREPLDARTLPIIVLSACATARDANDADEAGADLFLTKPCLPEELVAAIRRVLRPVRARRMLRALTGRHRRRQG